MRALAQSLQIAAGRLTSPLVKAPLLVGMLLACTTGCSETPPQEVEMTPTRVRAARRAYDGAPPVIPHEAFGPDCRTCHTETGRQVPGVGIAPANPHAASDYEGSLQHCRQCHVFQSSEAVFRETTFQGLPQVAVGGERLYASAPPVIPHRVFMRENCAACHSGPAAREEIACSHPERTNCRQCHVAGASR